jgi:hypothetical protein
LPLCRVPYQPMQLLLLLLSFLLGAALEALSRWIITTASHWRERRLKKLGRRLRVVVLVDGRRPSRRRTCFWKDVLARSDHDLRNRAKVKLLSISDELRKRRNPATNLFSPEKTDVIIINWDAMNGDPVYGSDRCYEFLEHYRPDMLEWLFQGGLLLVESQGASWSAAQGPYDCFVSMFPGSKVHLGSGMWTLGGRAILHPDSQASPLVEGLAESDLELKPGGLWARKVWFPRRLLRTDIQSLRFARRHQHHLHRGYVFGSAVTGVAGVQQCCGVETRWRWCMICGG